MKDHLLGRIYEVDFDGDDIAYTDEERVTLSFVGGRIYRHKILRINYTTSDMRRDQDSLNPRTHANIMVLSHDDGNHPYWYARILGIFHAIVQHPKFLEPKVMDFLWVRWYGADPDERYKSGWKGRRLPRIGFIPHVEDGLSPAFGFVDPNHVIRGVHLIPAFHFGVTDDLLPPSSTARLDDENNLDYINYYVNM